MAYSELIKSFEKIRSYMREFYVYGFKSREEYDAKSARSYDNERRRIESWLGEYMEFRQDASGKAVFISVDNRDVPHNPLYNAFKTRSFTDNGAHFHGVSERGPGAGRVHGSQKAEGIRKDRAAGELQGRAGAGIQSRLFRCRPGLLEGRRVLLLGSGSHGRDRILSAGQV